MKYFISFITIIITMSFITACGPAKVEQFNMIDTNETAFLVPFEGMNKADQKKFMSVDYLNNAKVAAKRISLPLRKWKTGYLWFSYNWIPTMGVIKVNRLPVTREWTGDSSTGTNSKNQALWVESADSIGFGVGVNVTALITEANAATFLYYFAGKSLSQVVDENVRGKVNSILSREFARYNLEKARREKNTIFDIAAKETVNEFIELGVTITNLGLAEGLVYGDKEIQQAINAKFKAEMEIQIQEQRNLTQKQINTRNVDIATAEALAALKRANGMVAIEKSKADAAKQFFKEIDSRRAQVQLEIDLMRAEAMLAFAKNIKPGTLPSNILPEGSGLLFGLDAKNR